MPPHVFPAPPSPTHSARSWRWWRSTDTKNDKLVTDAVSAGRGGFKVFDDDAVFGEDGAVMACKWVDDDGCAEF